jgi:hypothetical protein
MDVYSAKKIKDALRFCPSRAEKIWGKKFEDFHVESAAKHGHNLTTLDKAVEVFS